ncbi:hypothetical protein BYT27DRAFT_7103895, partial [Phlegmacium glaucopus]
QSFRLQVVHRQGGDSPDQVTFRNILSHASCGGLNQEAWRLLSSLSERNLTPETRWLFEDSVCLYTMRSVVHNLNITELQALNQPCCPCTRINARHDGGPSATDEAGGLENHIFLVKGAKMMVTRNIWQVQVEGGPECRTRPFRQKASILNGYPFSTTALYMMVSSGLQQGVPSYDLGLFFCPSN